VTRNLATVEGVLETVDVLRFTPAGLAILDLELKHVSIQQEAGHDRRVEVIIPVRASGQLAEAMQQLPLGKPLSVQGFLAHRSIKNRSVVLHATAYRQELES
jgi:primosomal replication protein N